MNLVFGKMSWCIPTPPIFGRTWRPDSYIAPAVWVLRNLSFKNVDNPVIRALVYGNGGKQMIAALEFLRALQEFEDEDKNGIAEK